MGEVNQQPLLNVQPTFLNSTTNGKKYIFQDPNATDIYAYLAVLEGTAYEMGYAMGTLFQKEILYTVQTAPTFYNDPDYDWVASVPKWMLELDLSSDSILQIGFHFEEVATERFIKQRFVDELQGLADATGIPYIDLLAINLFPELTRAGCTVLGTWGDATVDGLLYQLRGLDYVPQNPLNIYQTIVIYKPTAPGAHTFANFIWPGMIGVLAGYNGNIGVGERVHSDYSDYDNVTTIFGEPWMFVLRNVVEYADNLEDAVNTLYDSNRTYEVFLGVGSQVDHSFRGFQYAYAQLNMYTDQNWTYNFSDYHPQLDGVIYFADGGSNTCIANILEANYGNITAELIYRQITGLHHTGNTIMAVYSYDTNEVYLSFATNLQPAYLNPIFYLNMTQLFNINVSAVEEVLQ